MKSGQTENIIFASYGNDSVALIQWAIDNQLPGVTVAYSNTGWAADWWYDRVARAEVWVQSHGMNTVQLESVGMADLCRKKKAWPRGGGGRFQFCTRELKEVPAVKWLAEADPDCDAVCLIGVRREESANRATFPEHVVSSDHHGGRELWAPLVRHTEAQRNELIDRTPFDVLPHRSKECWPCVNARKPELKLMDEKTINRIEMLEDELGTNSKGNRRVMFSPKRHNGAVGIRAVIDDARKFHADLFAGSCDGGWCGT